MTPEAVVAQHGGAEGDGQRRTRGSNAVGDDSGRNLAEWVSFSVALALVLAVLGVFAAELGADDAAAPVARVEGPVEAAASGYRVPVVVRNDGDRTAADVQVVAELATGTQTHSAEQTVDFLPGGADRELVFVFPIDPRSGDLEVVVRSYARP